MFLGEGMRRTADALTVSRGFIGALIVLLALSGKDALAAVILLLIVGWTTDILDGRIARLASRSDSDSAEGELESSSWASEHDFTFDMILVLSSFIYLSAAGFISLPLAIGYLLIAAVFILWSSGSKSITELFAFPLVALPLIIAYLEEPWIAYIFGAWIILALVFCWQRFTGVVREFIEDIKGLNKT